MRGLEKRPKRGFTIIEIMVVLVILAGLAVVVGRSVMGSAAGAKIKNARIQLSVLRQKVEMFYLNENRFPTTEEGVAVLAKPSTALGNRSYIDEEQTQDPWGYPIRYAIPGPMEKDFDLVSYGSDGKPGGTGDATDLSIWDKKSDPPK